MSDKFREVWRARDGLSLRVTANSQGDCMFYTGNGAAVALFPEESKEIARAILRHEGEPQPTPKDTGPQKDNPDKKPERLVRSTFWTLGELFPVCTVSPVPGQPGSYTVSGPSGKSSAFHESWWPRGAADLYAAQWELGYHPEPEEFRQQLEVVERVAREGR